MLLSDKAMNNLVKLGSLEKLHQNSDYSMLLNLNVIYFNNEILKVICRICLMSVQ